MRFIVSSAALAAALLGGSALAGVSSPGNPADFYVLSDSGNEVYQYTRTSPWPYVPGTYPGIGKPLVFSNAGQVLNNAPYLGAVAGTAQDFFIGGFLGLTRISGSTGAFVAGVVGGQRLGPATAPNGNVVVGGPTGIEEYDANTNAFVRTVNTFGNGSNLACFAGNNMFVIGWNSGTGKIKQFDFISGLSSGPDIPVPFNPQKLAIGPDGALYAAALYESPVYEGVYRYNGSGWTLFADTSTQPGGGPHAFAWDPIGGDLFISQNSGEIFRFNGTTGAFLNGIDVVPTKLTDLLFTSTVPAPAAGALLGLAGLAGTRRRRA